MLWPVTLKLVLLLACDDEAAAAAGDARDEHAQSVCCETSTPPTLHLRIIVAEPFAPQTCLLSMLHVCSRCPYILPYTHPMHMYVTPVAFSSSEGVPSRRLRYLAGAPASWLTKVLLHLWQPKWCPPTRSPNLQLDRKASPFMCWSF